MTFPDTLPESDITIIGAGPVGGTLALLLARRAADPSRIVVCGITPAPPSAASSAAPAALADQAEHDRTSSGEGRQRENLEPHSLALNHGSRVLLESVGGWPEHGAPIHTVHVSQRGRLGSTVIRHTDFKVPELGTVHPYARLQAGIDKALAASGVTLRYGGAARLIEQDSHGVAVDQDETGWRSRIVIQAEGGFTSDSRSDGRRDLGQHALLATIRAERPAYGQAWERFTREGPLALLPINVSPARPEGDTYSVIWCCGPARAEALRDMPDAEFGRHLEDAFSLRMGRLQPMGARRVFPLQMKWRHSLVNKRCVAIGNAAQALHPVAGQGLNLGLRDAAQLAQAIASWVAAPDADPEPLLRRFGSGRQADRLITRGITEFLPRIFSTGWPPIEHACGLALLTLDLAPTLRRPLARQLMHGLRT